MISRPILSGNGITLRPLSIADAEPMLAATGDPEITRLTGSRGTFTLEQTRAHCERVAAATDRVDYAITRLPDPAWLGEVVLNQIDWHNRCANFRIMLASRSLFGHGLGTEATRLLVEYGFTALDLHRIELEVFEFNPRARRTYEKVGFVAEGVRRDALLWDGRYYNAILMSMLQPEFMARRQELQDSIEQPTR